MAKDYSREAAHERYGKAAAIAAAAGSNTQAGLNEAYKQLNQNASWTPEEGWAENYQYGVEAAIPSWLTLDEEERFPSYSVANPEDYKMSPATMMSREELAKMGEDIIRDNELMAAKAYPELRSGYETKLQGEFSDYQQRELDWAKDRAKQDLVATWPANDEEGLQQELANIDAWTKVPAVYADERRRWYDEDGNLSSNPNIFGITSQTKTPRPIRDIYDYYDSMYGSNEGSLTHERRAIESNDPWLQNEFTGLSGGVVDQSEIDDGNPLGRQAEKMTGDQYYKYRTLYGLPGRPVDEIVNSPYALYSKQSEMDEYGFVPYLASDEAIYGAPLENVTSPLSLIDPFNYGFQGQAAVDLINNAYQSFSNGRRDNVDYSVVKGQNRYSAEDFDKARKKYLDDVESSDYDVVDSPDLASEYAVPYRIVNEKTGEVAPSALSDRVYLEEDGSVVVLFDDGSSWSFDDKDDYKNNVKSEFTNGDDATQWWNVPPLVMDDGGTFSFSDIMSMDNEINGHGKSGFIDYGPFNWGKKNVSMPEFDKWVEKMPEWLAEGNIVPWIVDMALGSLPYFKFGIGELQGLSHAASRAHGFSPYRNSENGTYSLISEDPTSRLATQEAVSEAILPMMEHLWGPMGHNTLGRLGVPIRKALGLGEASYNPFARTLKGALGEAAEEIPGNIFEEGSNTGFDEFYYDYSDSYDKAGRPIRVPTDLGGQIWNFGTDIPESSIGGFLLGGGIGSATQAFTGDYSEYIKDPEGYTKKAKMHAALEDLQDKYDRGKISEDEFNRAMLQLAIGEIPVVDNTEWNDAKQFVDDGLSDEYLEYLRR